MLLDDRVEWRAMTDVSRPRAELRLSDELRAQFAVWSREAAPREACGLLIGSRTGECSLVEHVRLARNLDAEHTDDRFEVHPADHVAIDAEARALGLEVVGSWHSHPNGVAVPSKGDRVGAVEGWSHVIVATRERGACEVRSWRLEKATFVEERVAAS